MIKFAYKIFMIQSKQDIRLRQYMTTSVLLYIFV